MFCAGTAGDGPTVAASANNVPTAESVAAKAAAGKEAGVPGRATTSAPPPGGTVVIEKASPFVTWQVETHI